MPAKVFAPRQEGAQRFMEERLRIGDRVRLRGLTLPATGVIADTLSDDYVLVRWHDMPTPLIHRRGSLTADEDAKDPARE
jgi:hypothetical protein